MKKTFQKLVLVAATIVALSICACGSSANIPTDMITIDGDLSSGYEWVADENYNAGVVQISDYDYVENGIEDDAQSGGGGVFVFTLTGISKGKTEITFNCVGSEEEAEPVEQRVYKVRVDSDLAVYIREIPQ